MVLNILYHNDGVYVMIGSSTDLYLGDDSTDKENN